MKGIPNLIFTSYKWKNDFSYARNKVLRRIETEAERRPQLNITHFLFFDSDDVLDPDSEKNLKMFARNIDRIPKEKLHKDYAVKKTGFSLQIKGIVGESEIPMKIWQPRIGPLRSNFINPVHESFCESLEKIDAILLALHDIIITHKGYEDGDSMRKRQKEVYIPLMEKRLEKEPENLCLASMLLEGYLQFEKHELLLETAEKVLKAVKGKPFKGPANEQWFKGSVIIKAAMALCRIGVDKKDENFYRMAIVQGQTACMIAYCIEHMSKYALILEEGGQYSHAYNAAKDALNIEDKVTPLVQTREFSEKLCNAIIDRCKDKIDSGFDVKDQLDKFNLGDKDGV